MLVPPHIEDAARYDDSRNQRSAQMPDEFEWDAAKSDANKEKRGIAFDVIVGMDWSSAQIILDDRRDYGETRFQVRGLIAETLHVAVFVWRDGRKRIISLRKANPRERRAYATETGPQQRDAERPQPGMDGV